MTTWCKRGDPSAPRPLASVKQGLTREHTGIRARPLPHAGPRDGDLGFADQVPTALPVPGSVDEPSGLRLTEMFAIPTHHDLERSVEPDQSRLRRNQEAMPDGWADAKQGYCRLLDGTLLGRDCPLSPRLCGRRSLLRFRSVRGGGHCSLGLVECQPPARWRTSPTAIWKSPRAVGQCCVSRCARF